ncbi:unnamed protein product [Effrenium voratum]|nr:unnamed protein product [Effrenium voratum]
MELPGAIQEKDEAEAEKSQLTLPLSIRRSSEDRPKCPSYTARVWEHGIAGWHERNHFCAGLEVDLHHDFASCSNVLDPAQLAEVQNQKEVHLPSNSLTALTQLQESLKLPGGLLLDVADSRTVQFTELFSAMLSQLGKEVPGSIVQEAEILLNEHPYITQERLPSKDDAVGEAIEIFLCSTASNELSQPVLALARLFRKAVVGFDDAEGDGEMRFAAVVLCDRECERSGRALARALATTFMDEDFVMIARSASKDEPELIGKAIDTYLAKLTIVPTVKLKADQPSGRGDCLLSESLVTGIQRRMSLTTAAEALKDVQFERQVSTEEVPQVFYIEVDRHSSHEWHMERCLRQGLEVDLFVKEDTPHLPRVSCNGLQEVKRLVAQDCVAIDVMADTSGAVDALLARLRLPAPAVDEVQAALTKRLTGTAQQKEVDADTELVQPDQEDESVLVLTMCSENVPESSGIFAAFLRMKVALPLAGKPPVRFLIALVGPRAKASDVVAAGESLAALMVDEDLSGKMVRAKDGKSLVAAFENRLGDLVLLPHAHMHSRRNLEDEMLLSPKGAVASPKSRRNSQQRDKSSRSLGVTGTKSYVNSDGQIVTRVKSDVGFDHMHGLSEEEREHLVWRAVAFSQKYALPLVLGVTIAMIWINVDEHSYHEVVDQPIVKDFKILGHDASLHFLINDIFMCFFFGLAIKEVTEALLPGGSLSPLRRATNPLMATLGGVVGPVATYVLFVVIFHEASLFDGMMCVQEAEGDASHRLLAVVSNETQGVFKECRLADFINGWGVPTATDISLAWMFAILIFGAGHPAINYLLLLAIADDALGMGIIAIAYPDPIHPVEPVWLLLVVAGSLVAFLLRFAGVRFWTPYVFLAGPISWFGLIMAQVHPALALVGVVPFMPATHHHANAHLSDDEESDAKSKVEAIGVLIPRVKSEILRKAAQEFLARQGAPLHAFEHHLKLGVDFGMFFFGVCNAGVKLNSVGTLTMATVIALIVGKTLGIVFFALLAHVMGFLLPVGLTVVDLFAMSALGGVGLTVALFVSNEAFVDIGLRSQAKMGAVFSVASAFLAFCMKFFGDKIFYPKQAEEDTQVERIDDDEDSEVEADEWLDVVAMNDIMQALWTQRKYQARGTALPMQKMARSVSKQSSRNDLGVLLDGRGKNAWQRSGSKERLERPGSKEPIQPIPTIPEEGKSGRTLGKDTDVIIENAETSAIG